MVGVVQQTRRCQCHTIDMHARSYKASAELITRMVSGLCFSSSVVSSGSTFWHQIVESPYSTSDAKVLAVTSASVWSRIPRLLLKKRGLIDPGFKRSLQMRYFSGDGIKVFNKLLNARTRYYLSSKTLWTRDAVTFGERDGNSYVADSLLSTERNCLCRVFVRL